MDTRSEFARVQQKAQTKEPVSLREFAVALANDDNALAGYLITNDYMQVYKLLNESNAPLVIGDNAPFTPDADRCAAELHALIQKKDWQDLNYVLHNFHINMNANNWTSHADLLRKLSDINAITPDGKGSYIFKLQFA